MNNQDSHKKAMNYLWMISTDHQMLQSLQNPNAQDYQEKWSLFYKKYHSAIITYIMRLTKWPQHMEYQAQDIASLLYERGLRWSFHNIREGIRFRQVLMTLAKQSLFEYNGCLQSKQQFTFIQELENQPDPCNEDLPSYLLKKDILFAITEVAINSYQGKEKFVIQTICNTGKLPTIATVMEEWNLSYEAAKKRKQRENEGWTKLWREFKQKLYDATTELAYDEIGVKIEQESLKNV